MLPLRLGVLPTTCEAPSIFLWLLGTSSSVTASLGSPGQHLRTSALGVAQHSAFKDARAPREGMPFYPPDLCVIRQELAR